MCACFQWLFKRPANEEDDNSSESSGAIPSIPPDLHLEDLSPEELRFTTSYPDPDSATKVILSPRSRQAVSIADVRKLDEAHARIRTMRVLYQSRLRYKVWKVGRKSGNLTVRWLEIKMSEEGDPKEVVLRKRRGGDAESDEDDVGVRFSKLSNLRVKWGDENGNRCLRAEFGDRSCSPIIIRPLGVEGGGRDLLDSPTGNDQGGSDYTVKEHPTINDEEYLEDLMYLLTAYHYKKANTNSHPSVPVISTFRCSLQDGIFTSMQNYGNRLSSDGTAWELIRHEIDGSRVLKSQSFAPNVSRFKIKTHVPRKLDDVWSHLSNWCTRPLYDTELYRANVLREVEVEGGGGELQVVYYRYDQRGASAMGNREFVEGRLIVNPEKEGKRTGRIITYPIRSDVMSTYTSSIPGHGVGACKALRGTHHECSWFVTEFGNQGWCRVEVIVKMELESKFFEPDIPTYYLRLLDNMKATLPPEQTTVDLQSSELSPPPFPLKHALTLSNSVMGYECKVVKGMPGVGFGMAVEVKGVLMEVTHVVPGSIKYEPLEVNGKAIRGHEIMEVDIIVEVEGEPVGGGTSALLKVMRACKIGGSVNLGLERLAKAAS